MSKLADLISAQSPIGVPWRSLDEIATFKTGEQLNKSLLAKTGKFPVINGGISPSGFHDVSNQIGPAVTISQGGASAGYVSWMAVDFWAGAHCYVVTPKSEVDARFLYFSLKNAQPELQDAAQGAGIPGLNRGSLAKVKLQVPSLEIQREIVRILDTFTALEAELEAELEARKKQYRFYRDHLLTFPEQGGVRWVPMDEISRIRNGADWKSLPEGDIPVYGSGGVMAHVGKSIHSGPSVLVPRKGSLGNLFYTESPFWTVDTCFYTEIDQSKILPKFLFYVLKTKNLAALNVAGGVPSLTQTMLNKVLVPLPTIATQIEVVEVLGKFDLLLNDLSSGLPGEIESRRKQYEYYRDKLLTFPEVVA